MVDHLFQRCRTSCTRCCLRSVARHRNLRMPASVSVMEHCCCLQGGRFEQAVGICPCPPCNQPADSCCSSELVSLCRAASLSRRWASVVARCATSQLTLVAALNVCRRRTASLSRRWALRWSRAAWTSWNGPSPPAQVRFWWADFWIGFGGLEMVDQLERAITASPGVCCTSGWLSCLCCCSACRSCHW